MYPTYMQQTKGFSSQMASKATIIAKTGAIVGGTVCLPFPTSSVLPPSPLPGILNGPMQRRFAVIIPSLSGAGRLLWQQRSAGLVFSHCGFCHRAGAPLLLEHSSSSLWFKGPGASSRSISRNFHHHSSDHLSRELHTR